MLPDYNDSTPGEPVSPAEPEPPAPIPPREPFWDYTDLLLLIGSIAASIAVIVFIGVLIAGLSPPLRRDPTPLALPFQLVFYGLIYLGFRVIFKGRYHMPVFASLGWRHARFNPGIAMIGGAVLAFAVSGIASLLHTPQVPSPIDKLVDSTATFVLLAVTVLFAAPIIEELVFRGFLQPLLSRTFGVVAGILITAAIFGSLHAPEYSFAWQYAFAVFIAGVVFGWIRARTNSVIPSTIMHGCYNLVFLTAFVVSKHGKW